MDKRASVAILLAAVLATFGAARAQEKPAKHPVVDELTDIGPTAKRQAGYMLDEITQFFERVDKVMTSEDTSKTDMENAYQRATHRSMENWTERQQKVLDSYFSWARQQGRKETKLPGDWSAYMNRVAYFLSDMADGRGYQAAVWKRELNTANKRFEKFAKKAPKAIVLYRSDVEEADKEMVAADDTLDLEVAKLDDLKRHARHLRKVRNLIKNLSGYMVHQQRRGKEIMEDKALKPDTFGKDLEDILKWKAECEADPELPKTCKQVPTYWHQYGKEALDKYRKNYEKVEDTLVEFFEGSIFEDSDFFNDLDYGRLVEPVDDLLERVEERIRKIQGG